MIRRAPVIVGSCLLFSLACASSRQGNLSPVAVNVTAQNRGDGDNALRLRKSLEDALRHVPTHRPLAVTVQLTRIPLDGGPMMSEPRTYSHTVVQGTTESSSVTGVGAVVSSQTSAFDSSRRVSSALGGRYTITDGRGNVLDAGQLRFDVSGNDSPFGIFRGVALNIADRVKYVDR